MANSTKPEVSAEELKHAQDLWVTFTQWAKWGTVFVVVIMVLMALFLV